MADTRVNQNGNSRSHYTRNQGKKANLEVQSNKSLVIVRDQSIYESQAKVFEKMKSF